MKKIILISTLMTGLISTCFSQTIDDKTINEIKNCSAKKMDRTTYINLIISTFADNQNQVLNILKNKCVKLDANSYKLESSIEPPLFWAKTVPIYKMLIAAGANPGEMFSLNNSPIKMDVFNHLANMPGYYSPKGFDKFKQFGAEGLKEFRPVLDPQVYDSANNFIAKYNPNNTEENINSLLTYMANTLPIWSLKNKDFYFNSITFGRLELVKLLDKKMYYKEAIKNKYGETQYMALFSPDCGLPPEKNKDIILLQNYFFKNDKASQILVNNTAGETLFDYYSVYSKKGFKTDPIVKDFFDKNKQSLTISGDSTKGEKARLTDKYWCNNSTNF